MAFAIIRVRHPAAWCVLAALLVAATATAQVIVIDKNGNATTSTGQATTTSYVDRRYAQIEPTKVALTQSVLDAKTRLELIRAMQAEQGFAMRPFPRGGKGLTLAANGKLEPAGESYLNMVTSQGLSAKPGDRLAVTDIKFDHTKIVFDLNGGPFQKHRFLRHIEIGSGPYTNPVVQGDEQEAVGARLTLTFHDHVPELTAAQVKALLAPLISFDVKTPVQAFTDTLPPILKQAILDHHVLVGMTTDMVLFAKGQPDDKSREMDGLMPFEEWIYGRPPKDVEFVRINGNRVIRVEIAKIGEPPVVFTRDVVDGMMRTDGTPLTPPSTDPKTHTVQLGDVQRNPDTQAAAPPPSLRNPGEELPRDKTPNTEVMKPVQFPKQKPDDQPVAHQGTQTAATLPSGQSTTPSTASGNAQPATPDSSQPAPAPATAKPATPDEDESQRH
jgi:hypothetical protein